MMTSKAGWPLRPTQPACCLSFQAVLGSPTLTHMFRLSTSRPMAATSVQTSTVQFLKLDYRYTLFYCKKMGFQF